jgi:hypothetical protein
MPEVSLFSEILFDLHASADTTPVPKILYSRKESAYALSISIRSLDLVLAANEMKFRRIGRKVLIPATEIERYARRDHSCLSQHPVPLSESNG